MCTDSLRIWSSLDVLSLRDMASSARAVDSWLMRPSSVLSATPKTHQVMNENAFQCPEKQSGYGVKSRPRHLHKCSLILTS